MKSKPSQIIENARVRRGTYASETGCLYGAFLIQRRGENHTLKVIASDGSDWELCGMSGEPWEHVSVSCVDRTPTWEEMCWVKSQFFEPHETVLEFHPPESEYVNHHEFCLHMWRPTITPIPLPPSICVGPKEAMA